MKCEHCDVDAAGLYRVPYLGKSFWYCKQHRDAAAAQFGEVVELKVAFRTRPGPTVKVDPPTPSLWVPAPCWRCRGERSILVLGKIGRQPCPECCPWAGEPD